MAEDNSVPEEYRIQFDQAREQLEQAYPGHILLQFELIDEIAVARWVDIGEDQNVALSITRGQMDDLFYSHTQMSAAMTEMHYMVEALRQGIEDARLLHHFKASMLQTSALNHFRRFYRGVVSGGRPV